MATNDSQTSLLPVRHANSEFFIADVFDTLPFKDDIASMEHPIFTLTKGKDMREFEYKKDNITINVTPSMKGLPTIFDKDVLLYCGSLLMNQINQNKHIEGYIPPKTLRISSHDLLVATNRMTNGQGYKLLKQALERLKGVMIKTNVQTNKRQVTSGFGLIESYRIVESSKLKNRMVRLEITLSDWLYNSILGNEVLTINRDYFRVGRPLERRLYEIARKFCGRSSEWKIGLEKLQEKTGSQSTLAKFRFMLKQLAEHTNIPDYRLELSKDDIVTFYKESASKNQITDIENLPYIKPETIAKGSELVKRSGKNISYPEIHSQFSQSLTNGFTPDNVDGAFINFVKKKIQDFK